MTIRPVIPMKMNTPAKTVFHSPVGSFISGKVWLNISLYTGDREREA